MAKKRTATGPSATYARDRTHDGTVAGAPERGSKDRRFSVKAKPRKAGESAPDVPKTLRKRRDAARRRR